MIDAGKARDKTKARLTVIAKEFIINNVDPEIQKAIDGGLFYTTIDMSEVTNAAQVGKEAVCQLEKAGYHAKFNESESKNNYEAHITLDWMVDED